MFVNTLTTEPKIKPKFAWRKQAQNSSLLVALVALLFYGTVVLVTINFYGNHDLRDFAGIGKIFYLNRTASQIIKVDPHYNYFQVGYDGQFSYFIALDPPNARYYTDLDSYRYTRILYPLAVRLLALGQSSLVPLSLVLINLIAIAVGTWAIAARCRLQQLSPWFALVYAFCIGQFTAFSVDVGDILAYTLVAVAIYALTRWPDRLLAAGVLFGLAALARETTLIFPAVYSVFFFFRWLNSKEASEKRVGRKFADFAKILAFGLLAIVPFLIWQEFLFLWLGNYGLSESVGIAKFPFGGLLPLRPFTPAVLEVIQTAFFPALICIAAVLWTFWCKRISLRLVEFWLLFSNALFFGLMLPTVSLTSIFSADRIGLGIVLSALYCLPQTKNRTWFYVCAGIWLSATILFALNPNSALFRDHSVYP